MSSLNSIFITYPVPITSETGLLIFLFFPHVERAREPRSPPLPTCSRQLKRTAGEERREAEEDKSREAEKRGREEKRALRYWL